MRGARCGSRARRRCETYACSAPSAFGRRFAVPQVLDQPVDRDHLAPGDQQQREHAPLARAAEVGRLVRAVRLENRVQRAESSHPQHNESASRARRRRGRQVLAPPCPRKPNPLQVAPLVAAARVSAKTGEVDSPATRPIHNDGEESMTAATTARPDVAEMVFVHNCFRQQFGALPGLVRAVPDADTARAARHRRVPGGADHLAASPSRGRGRIDVAAAAGEGADGQRADPADGGTARTDRRAVPARSADNAAAFAATADARRPGGTRRHPDRPERRPRRASARRGGAHPAAGRAGDDGRASGTPLASGAGRVSRRTASWSSSGSC